MSASVTHNSRVCFVLHALDNCFVDNVCVAVCNRLKFSSIVGRFLFFGTGHHDQCSDIIVYFRMIWGRNIQLTQSVCKRLCFREIVNLGWTLGYVCLWIVSSLMYFLSFT